MVSPLFSTNADLATAVPHQRHISALRHISVVVNQQEPIMTTTLTNAEFRGNAATLVPPAPRTTALPAARAVGVRKIYGHGEAEVRALDGVDAEFGAGRFTAIMGPSGSGKSTLMHVLAGLDTLSKGAVYIGDVNVSTLNDRQLTQLRRDRIGFIFQAFNLV